MADVVDRSTRSRMMAAVRTKDTLPEMRVRKYLHFAGLRFRVHVRGLPGSPDIVLPRYRTVIFVHGCFWHQHGSCLKAKLPTTNQRFWSEKISGNALRDRLTKEALQAEGWRVLTVWECETPDLKRLGRIVDQVRASADRSR
ncbi:MAG TPA: DNA mismatch endonuclease Vsr [Thermoanaerobaculia bacterium]|nr:DNA mismatch endonuclease Vsr [Thermoanaerobaculia bacterium]